MRIQRTFYIDSTVNDLVEKAKKMGLSRPDFLEAAIKKQYNFLVKALGTPDPDPLKPVKRVEYKCDKAERCGNKYCKHKTPHSIKGDCEESCDEADGSNKCVRC